MCYFFNSLKKEIFMDLHVLRYPEYEKRIFNGWSMFECVRGLHGPGPFQGPGPGQRPVPEA